MTERDSEEALQRLTEETREIWDAKADFWDARMGEGNAFHRELVGPVCERLLAVRPGEIVLDVACGNGQFARRMAELGATVLATDFSQRFLDRAAERSAHLGDRIAYRLADATDAGQLLALGEERFDAVTCVMALMDMTTIEPLARALPRLLTPGGRFVFAIMHPAFNSAAVKLALEEEDRDGELVETYFAKVSDYLYLEPRKGAGMPDEPAAHWYFHRPLSQLLTTFFRYGLMMDGIEEPAFSGQGQSSRALSWLHFTRIPPVFAARLRRP
jgi:2-polyprenyl-3-methyl-5-hydroxy-6-metoxy-1,4-benzoquinol methylase